jgi:hypothetical protein
LSAALGSRTAHCQCGLIADAKAGKRRLFQHVAGAAVSESVIGRRVRSSNGPAATQPLHICLSADHVALKDMEYVPQRFPRCGYWVRNYQRRLTTRLRLCPVRGQDLRVFLVVGDDGVQRTPVRTPGRLRPCQLSAVTRATAWFGALIWPLLPRLVHVDT